LPAVTVGLPFHAERDSLADAIRSVFAQSFTDWELLLVDDGSSDGSREIAERVRDPRVRLIGGGARRHLPARLNEIVQAARGELVARLDADDMLHPARLERQVQVFRDERAIDIVGTGMFNVDARGRLMSVTVPLAARAEPLHALRRDLVVHATTLATRAWLLENPYDERYPRAEDRELFARTCRTVRVAQLAEPLYLYFHRKDPTQTLRDYTGSCRDNRRIFRESGPALVGAFATTALITESIAKEAVFRAMTGLGLQQRLIERRGRRPTKAERLEAASTIPRVRATPVPGLD
jgi:glycosyltransferase involved in cell wall biosynthesis